MRINSWGRVLLVCALLSSCEAHVDDVASDAGVSATESTSTAPLTFTATADARVEKGKPSTNFGSSSALKVDNSPQYRTYLRFDVVGLSGTVTSARLRVYVNNGTSNGPALYASASTWSESSITWNNQPGPSGSVIADAGAMGTGKYFEFDVTALVTGNGAVSLVLVGASSDGLAMTSRETTSPPLLLVSAEAGEPTPPPTTSGTTYHVDPLGNDSADGLSPETAWRTTAKANTAPLAPGDALVFKRGGVFAGGLVISKSGTSTARITVGAYGAGERPVFRGSSSAVKLSGSYITATEIAADDASWAGFDVAGTFVRIERVTATRNVAGVHVRPTAADGAVVHSTIRDNTKMSVLTEGGDDDSGAFGIVLQGDRHEIAYNTISGHDAFSYDYGRDGSAVEVYGGQDNHIHHNIAENNDAFTELGNSRSRGNTFAHNLVRSTLADSIFLVTRGAQSSFGPVADTRVYKNTVYLTGANSQGFVCHAGCSSSILVMRDNVIQAVWKVGYADAAFDDGNGVYWGGQRQFTLGPGSVVADPRFVAPPTDLHVQSTSPAVDSGLSLGYAADLDGVAVPQDGNDDGTSTPDRGAYERP